MQEDHRLAAARAALHDKAVPLGLGDDLVLFFLNGLDDVRDLRLLLLCFEDLFEERIENDLFVPARDLLFGEVIAQAQILVFKIDELSVGGA